MTERPEGAPRPAAYRLLARLYLRGVTPDLLPVLREVPELADHLPLPDPHHAAGPEAPGVADELAAEHHRLHGLEVPPFASTFLEADGRLGGVATREVEGLYRTAGRGPGDRSSAGEHVGNLLGLLGDLAVEDGGAAGPTAVAAVAAAVLDHLLAWTPPLFAAVQRLGSPFRTRIGGLTLALLLDHRAALPRDLPRHGTEPPLPEGLTHPLEDPLANEGTGLAELARFLTTPVRSGLLLGPGDLRAIAREHGLPGGFGARARILETTLRSAGSFGRVEEVTASLRRRLEEDDAHLGGMVGEGLPPAFARPWRDRLEATGRVLERVERGAES